MVSVVLVRNFFNSELLAHNFSQNRQRGFYWVNFSHFNILFYIKNKVSVLLVDIEI